MDVLWILLFFLAWSFPVWGWFGGGALLIWFLSRPDPSDDLADSCDCRHRRA